LGQQLIAPADCAQAIDGVEEAQPAATAEKILFSRPTVAALGDTVPH